VKDKCAFTKRTLLTEDVLFMKGKCVFTKGTFLFWKTNVCFERQMCIFKNESVGNTDFKR